MPLQAIIGRNCFSPLRAAFRQGRPSLLKRLVVRNNTCNSRALGHRPVKPLPLCSAVHGSANNRNSCLSTCSSHMPQVQTITSEFLSADDPPAGTHLHLIVLNYVLPQQTAQLWHRATTRICADGGANRLYDQIVDMLPGVDPQTARTSFLPDLIKGDLDSVRADVQDFYTGKGVPMIDLSSDQETTDLEKCLLFLEGRLRAMSEVRPPAGAAPAKAAAQHHDPLRETVMTAAAAAAAAAAVSGNGLGHGAKAIGALNAAKAPGANDASTSNSSSFSAAYVGFAAAAAAAAALDSSVVQPEASACADVSNGTGLGTLTWREQSGADMQQLSPQQQQQQRHRQHMHHGHQQQQQQHQRQAASAAQPISGRIVFLNRLGSTHEPAQQQQAQQLLQHGDEHQHQQPQQIGAAGPAFESTSPATPSSSSSSRGGNGDGARPSSSGSRSGGGAHEVAATVLGSADATGEPSAKRLQQEHIILVLGALGGRLDHTLSNLNTLYCYRHLNMALWGDGNLVRLLRSGTARIQPSRAEGPTCGLVPLARPATASSTGLKWDLDNTHMCFRGLLSTSNIIASDTITVSTDEDLLWITAVEDTTTLRGVC